MRTYFTPYKYVEYLGVVFTSLKYVQKVIRFAADAKRRQYHKTRHPRGKKYTDKEMNAVQQKGNDARNEIAELRRVKKCNESALKAL